MFLRFVGQSLGAASFGAVLNLTLLRLAPDAVGDIDRLLNPLTRRISAISMNSGTHVRTKLFMLPQLTSPRLLRLGRPLCNSR